jgi:hypothetical protein
MSFLLSAIASGFSSASTPICIGPAFPKEFCIFLGSLEPPKFKEMDL